MRRLLLALAFAASAEGAEPDTPQPRLALGGEMSLALAPRDDGFFNETAYGYTQLRGARLDLLASLRLSRGFQVVADLRSQNLDAPRAYALYLRFRPFASRELQLQAGRIPPVFGSFPRRRYGQDNPLVSWPLVWQYLTSLRPDALPRSADSLLAQRGSGWSPQYAGYGDGAGVPVASAARWDTGIEAHYAEGPLALAVAVTQGTLSDPRFEDRNRGKQVSARAEWSAAPGLEFGVSAAQGEFLDASLPLPAGRFEQRAFGVDAEFARGRFVGRAEAIYSEWDLPRYGGIDRPLGARGFYVEGRWRFAPGWHVAGRLVQLDCGDVAGSGGLTSWEAPVRRLEAGIGWVPRHHVLLKLAYQRNHRDAGHAGAQDFLAGQLLLWF